MSVSEEEGWGTLISANSRQRWAWGPDQDHQQEQREETEKPVSVALPSLLLTAFSPVVAVFDSIGLHVGGTWKWMNLLAVPARFSSCGA